MVGAIAQKQDRALFGIILMVIAYLIFSFIDVSAKWLAIAGLPAMQLAFMRYVGHMAISTGLLVRDGDLGSLFRTKYLLVVMFSGHALGGTLAGLAAPALINNFGWHSVFIVGGIVPAALVVALLFLLPESARYLTTRGNSAARLRAISLLKRANPTASSKPIAN